MTEQGEVLAERYDDPHIAHRHLEQVTWATLLVSALPGAQPRREWFEAMDVMAATALRVLVIDRKNFQEVLREVPELTQRLLVTLSRRIRSLESSDRS